MKKSGKSAESAAGAGRGERRQTAVRRCVRSRDPGSAEGGKGEDPGGQGTGRVEPSTVYGGGELDAAGTGGGGKGGKPRNNWRSGGGRISCCLASAPFKESLAFC